MKELAERWERDPSSRIFLQLAEEYRRGGRMEEAVKVLERGLESHPTYLSALVSLGRCRLELGRDAQAVEALEQAVVYDPAQLVANKLLVEGYLRTGQAAKAAERLEFYRLFNDRDEEIDALEHRIAAATARAAEAPAEPEPRPARAGDVFDLGAPAAAATPPLGLERPAPAPRVAEPFGPLRRSDRAMRRIARAFTAAGLFPLAEPPEPPVVTAPPPAPAPAAEPEPVEAPAAVAPEPAPAETAAAAEVAPPPAAEEALPAPEPAAPQVAEPAPRVEPDRPPWGVGTRAAEVEFDAREEIVAAPFSPRTIGEEVEREVIEEPFDEVLEAGSAAAALSRRAPFEAEPAEAEEAPEPAEERPSRGSSTLGDLYLSQGHLEEAESQFRLVLEIRPEDPAALAGLAAIAERRAAPAAETAPERATAAPARSAGPTAPPAASGLTRRKLETLRGYLGRVLRARGGARVP